MIPSKALLWFVMQWVSLVVVETRSVSFLPLKHIHGATPKNFLRSTLMIRGGSMATAGENDDEEDEEITTKDITEHPEFSKLQSYRMQQQILMQLRATFLSEALARRGLPMPTLMDVATPEGSEPPQPVDWDCALATEEDPKSCLYSFDAEPYTKVVAPLDTTQWISLGALNRLRRTDITKVEPMWHSQYAILESWFDPESQYSLLQHVGIQGFLLNSLLQGLPIVLGLSLCVLAIICMPILEYIVNRIVVSGFLWSRWHQWSRFVHAALPLKLLLGQMAYQSVASAFGKLLSIVKDRLVEIECQILEQNIPLTVGVPDDDWDLDVVDLDEDSSEEEEDESYDEE
jgi:hypothetical protein